MKEKYITFGHAALSRAIRTSAQAAIAAIGTAAVMSSVDWRAVISTSLLSGILSLLMSTATGLPEATAPEDEA